MLERGLKTVARRASTHAQPGDRPDLIGKVIDQRFRVLSLIGSGGMADVYEVEHVTLGRKLALKLLRHTEQSNPAVTRRFSREARALSRITSEHVVSIFDHGILPNGFPYFVMDLLRGRTLRWYRPATEAVRWAAEFELPKGWNADDVAGLHVAAQGVSVVAKDGRFAHYDIARAEWALHSNALTDGVAT